MDFSNVVRKYGETTVKLAMIVLVSSMRQVIADRVSTAVDGTVRVSMEELRADSRSIARVLAGSPFTKDEKCILISKAWEIISP